MSWFRMTHSPCDTERKNLASKSLIGRRKAVNRGLTTAVYYFSKAQQQSFTVRHRSAPCHPEPSREICGCGGGSALCLGERHLLYQMRQRSSP